LRRRIRLRALLKWGSVVALAGFLLIQTFPYGHSHSNPAFHSEPPWDSPRTRELVVDACYDCHSNLTEWPWYSYVAPVSWLVLRDVYEGREELNFSEWQQIEKKRRTKAAREKAKEKKGKEKREKVDELLKVVLNGEMPLWFYPLLHPDARLSATEREELAEGLARTFGLPFPAPTSSGLGIGVPPGGDSRPARSR
jgi:heme-binding protein